MLRATDRAGSSTGRQGNTENKTCLSAYVSVSVSYHRGKTVKNDEGEKRLSYPGNAHTHAK